MNHEWSDFWWSNITGANYLVSKVSNALLDNTPAVLIVPSDLPWRYQMRNAVEAQFRKNADSADIIVKLVDAVDDCSTYSNPGRFLLEHFGQNREVRNGYRERSSKTIQAYLLEKDVLKNTIVWVKGLSGKQAKAWISFCGGYTPDHIGQGQFVLEIHGEPRIKNSSHIHFSDYISRHDVQLFNSFVLNEETELPYSWKNYISTVSAALCDVDAEISAELIKFWEYKKDDPIEVITHISNMEGFSRRGAEIGSGHILALARCKNIDDLCRRVWSAQVRVLFPLIELERVSIIQDSYEELQQMMDQNEVIQYRERVIDPFDIELGTLDYYMSHRGEDGYYMIYMPDEEVRDEIRFLHECRNILAHAKVCTPEQVTRLLDQILFSNDSGQ